MKLILFLPLLVSSGFASDLPKNIDIRVAQPILEGPPHFVDLPADQAIFHRIIDEITNYYQPFAQANGATLVSRKYWSNQTLNAFASRNGTEWIMSFYGGLFRHSTITLDGFAWVVCHEIAHHFAGAPSYPASLSWAASEGNADYYASHSCLRSFWSSTLTHRRKNLEYSDQRIHNRYPFAHYKCTGRYPAPVTDQQKRGLCTRILYASRSFANFNHALTLRSPRPGGEPAPEFWTADPNRVSQTQYRHSSSQCRLDTMSAGTLCPVPSSYPSFTIPGKFPLTPQPPREMLRHAAGFSCMRSFWDAGETLHLRQERYGEPWAYRPQCWFKPENLHFR